MIMGKLFKVPVMPELRSQRPDELNGRCRGRMPGAKQRRDQEF